MPTEFYNTLHHEVERFTPLTPGSDAADPLAGANVRMYTCGPTVYDYAHIGNFRAFLFADILRRYLEFRGATVQHVMNMTDVGHMTDDAIADSAGQDKLEVAVARMRESKKAGKAPVENPNDPAQVAQYFIEAFKDDARLLRLKVVSDADGQADDAARERIMPRPTRHIPEFIAMIQTLLEKKHAYVGADGVVYFDVPSFAEYGRLSGNSLEQLSHGAGGRTNQQAAKHNPADFFLWKPDPHHLMRWNSPWGEGYPGWHIECSAMAAEILGPSIDIHTGGEDNIFPHHECEIAQSEGATGKTFAQFWMHTRHLMVNGEKMSKSRGNFFTIRDLIAKGYDPLVVRWALISTRYRESMNFTLQGLEDAGAGVGNVRDLGERLALSVAAVDEAAGDGDAGRDLDPREHAMLDEFNRAMDDDLNTSAALAAVFTWAAVINKQKTLPFPQARSALSALRRIDQVLAVIFEPLQPVEEDRAVEIETLMTLRGHARAARDFAKSDVLRQQLAALGAEVKDQPAGSVWRPRLAPATLRQ